MTLLFILYFLICLGVGYLGIDRRMGFWGYFFFSLAFSPIIGLLLVLVSDQRKEVMRNKQLEEIQSSNERIEKLMDLHNQLYQDVRYLLAEKKQETVAGELPVDLANGKLENLINLNNQMREDVNKLLSENRQLHEEIDKVRSEAGTQIEKINQLVESK